MSKHTAHFLGATIAAVLTACAGSPPPPPAAPVAIADPHADAVAGLVGAWQGKVLGTPLGDFPFAIAFAREASGDIHGRAENGPGMYLDFRFHQLGPTWTLTEEGAL